MTLGLGGARRFSVARVLDQLAFYDSWFQCRVDWGDSKVWEERTTSVKG